MKSFSIWLREALAETVARIVVGVILGFLLAAIAGVASYGLHRFLLQEIQVPVVYLVILSLFSLVGLLAGVVPIWRLISEKRRSSQIHPLDESLEAATMAILDQLAHVEAGKQIYVEHQQKEFEAKTLSLFDTWEAHVTRYLQPSDHEKINSLRDEVSSRSLQHARPQAKQWIAQIKIFTQKARALVF